MPIHCICPNGHRLSVANRFAGAQTQCGRCGETVQVPRAEDGELSDTGILRLLGDYEPELRPNSPKPKPVEVAGDRDCPRCRRSVPQLARICPACNVYLPLSGKAAG